MVFHHAQTTYTLAVKHGNENPAWYILLPLTCPFIGHFPLPCSAAGWYRMYRGRLSHQAVNHCQFPYSHPSISHMMYYDVYIRCTLFNSHSSTIRVSQDAAVCFNKCIFSMRARDFLQWIKQGTLVSDKPYNKVDWGRLWQKKHAKSIIYIYIYIYT